MRKKSSHIHLRLPATLKREAQQIIEASGLDVSSAVRLYFAQIVLHGTIPLKFLTVNGLTPEFERELLFLAKDDDHTEGPYTSAKAVKHLKSL